MELSVVVPTVSRPSEIAVVECLKDCTFQEYELILRDDVPVTKARNEGYKQANTDKILFLDDDSMPRDGYLAEAAATLEDHAAVAGRTIHPRDDLFAGRLTAHYDFGDEPQYVDWFWGCNMGIRREALDAVGGWDENMGWGHEEKELAERIRRQHDIYYNPKMIVEHVYAESLRDYWRKRYQLEKETPYFLRKQGLSSREVLLKILSDMSKPSNYLGHSPPLTLARSGGRLIGTVGRFVGLLDRSREPREDEATQSTT